ncbi:MAG: DUF1571 domain-containing protein, partial [Planctomycetales bacterium]|nr:DUF1571 domain-containing protein [Planctomycetales bacterium]NIO33940.1 DUF1571 domain-containing protein [Planctomycetales bacterium]NIP03798.1 DUF1571 domain-containing protein [Planctomycetales bacterium]
MSYVPCSRKLLITSAILATCWLPVLPDDARAENAQPPGQHPLVPVIKMAYDGLQRIDREIQDYSCTLVKRERINGELGPHQYIYTKVRHEPFSVYMHFIAPSEMKGREVIYVAGQNGGKLRAHEAQGWKSKFGMVSLEPDSRLAMLGQRYPVTMTGVRIMTQRLVEVAEHDTQFGECEVNILQGGKINDRPCTCIQSVHPFPRKHFRYHMARVFIDEELQIPVRYAAYQWPAKPGGQPLLDEEYT